MSSGGRAATLRALAGTTTDTSEFRHPGHIFVRPSTGGLKDLEGGTLELVRLAGGEVAAVCEIFNSDGIGNISMGKVIQIAESLNLTVTSVEDVEKRTSDVGAAP